MKWEYKAIKTDVTGFVVGGKFDQNSFEQHLNGLGEQGWELVNVFDTNISLKINIVSKQPTCMYQLRFSRGPHDLFLGLSLVELV